MVRYYGYYSNVSRGKRQKEGLDDAIPCILDPQGMVRQAHHARLPLILSLSKDETDPLVCPRCNGTMRIISSIEDPSVIRDILNHLGLWLVRARPPPKAHAPRGHDGVVSPMHDGIVIPYADGDLQLQTHADTIYGDPEYTWDE
jgi:hypothetical protein